MCSSCSRNCRSTPSRVASSSTCGFGRALDRIPYMSRACATSTRSARRSWGPSSAAGRPLAAFLALADLALLVGELVDHVEEVLERGLELSSAVRIRSIVCSAVGFAGEGRVRAGQARCERPPSRPARSARAAAGRSGRSSGDRPGAARPPMRARAQRARSGRGRGSARSARARALNRRSLGTGPHRSGSPPAGQPPAPGGPAVGRPPVGAQPRRTALRAARRRRSRQPRSGPATDAGR